MKELLYCCKNLNFDYQLELQTIHALKNIHLEICQQEFVTLIGPSGSGKSSLLNLLALIESPQRGELYFQQQLLSEISERQKNHIRRYHLGLIFQSFHLMPALTAYENVEFFLIRQNVASRERREMVEHTLTLVGLRDHMMKRPLQLSGGQRQRVAIARALVKRPKVILADEPTASLDQKTGREIIELLLTLNRDEGVTIIMASHDPMVIELSPRRVRLSDGEQS